MSYLDLTLKEIHQALVDKKVTPSELLEEALKRAKENKDNAFEYICEKEAREFVKTLGPVEEDNILFGIPFLAKDNFSTEGIETTASSNILKGYVPVFNATVIQKLKDKKAVMIGKTCLDELAMGGTGTSGHLGKTYNPYDPTHQRMIGGSSSGSASLTASAVAPFALGSDTGDSVRKPASFGGLVGFKPTWGRISRYGLFPFACSLDHVGYFTRSVEDSAVLLNVLAGRDVNDSTSSTREVEDYTSFLKKNHPYKLAVLKEVISGITDPFLKEKFLKSEEELKKRGYVVEYVNFGEELLKSLYPTYIVISSAEATSNDANLDGIKFGPYHQGKTYQEVMFKARTEGFSTLIKRRFVLGSYCLMAENQEELFLRAQRNRTLIVRRINEILKDYDFIYVPAAPSIAPKFDESSDYFSTEYLVNDNLLVLGNFSGLPSITVPLAMEKGFPLGVNLMGRAFEEKALFEASEVVEEITGLKGLSYLNKKEGNL